MKRFFTILFATFLAMMSTSAFAQVSVGAGYLNSNFLEKTGSISSTSNFNGLYVEADYRIELIDDFFGITPGLRYTFAGSDEDFALFDNWNEQYLDIPVTFDLGYEFSDNFRLYAFVGPTFSFGLSSKVGIEDSNDKLDMYEFIKESTPGNEINYGRFDLMIGFGVGADLFEHLRIKAGFDQGLINRFTGVDNTKATRNLIKVGVAYIF